MFIVTAKDGNTYGPFNSYNGALMWAIDRFGDVDDNYFAIIELIAPPKRD